MIAPVIVGWGAQWYAYVPACVKVKLNVSPEFRRGESNATGVPASVVTVCSMTSALYHVTVSPTRAGKVAGLNGCAVPGSAASRTIWTSASAPAPRRSLLIEIAARLPMTRPPMTKPTTASVSNPPADRGDARYGFRSMPFFQWTSDRTPNTTTNPKAGIAETASQNAGFAGLTNVPARIGAKEPMNRIETAVPARIAHRLPRNVKIPETRKMRAKTVSAGSKNPKVASSAKNASALYTSAPNTTQSANGFFQNDGLTPNSASPNSSAPGGRGLRVTKRAFRHPACDDLSCAGFKSGSNPAGSPPGSDGRSRRARTARVRRACSPSESGRGPRACRSRRRHTAPR